MNSFIEDESGKLHAIHQGIAFKPSDPAVSDDIPDLKIPKGQIMVPYENYTMISPEWIRIEDRTYSAQRPRHGWPLGMAEYLTEIEEGSTAHGASVAKGI